MKKLLSEEGVMSVVFDMCRFGTAAEDGEGLGLVRKSTRVITNVEIRDVLDVRCEGGRA